MRRRRRSRRVSTSELIVDSTIVCQLSCQLSVVSSVLTLLLVYAVLLHYVICVMNVNVNVVQVLSLYYYFVNCERAMRYFFLLLPTLALLSFTLR